MRWLPILSIRTLTFVHEPLAALISLETLQNALHILGYPAVTLFIMIESAGQKACYISDLIPTTAHLDLTWGMAFDLFPLEVIESKKRFYKEAIPEKWLVIFTHDHNVPWAYVEAGEKGKLLARPA